MGYGECLGGGAVLDGLLTGGEFFHNMDPFIKSYTILPGVRVRAAKQADLVSYTILPLIRVYCRQISQSYTILPGVRVRAAKQANLAKLIPKGFTFFIVRDLFNICKVYKGI